MKKQKEEGKYIHASFIGKVKYEKERVHQKTIQ